jgi:hypothetical protein
MPSMSKEAIVAAIQECAQKIGRTPYNAELEEFCPSISRGRIRMEFGSYRRALQAAGLEGLSRGVALPLELLFRDWADVARRLKKLPSMAEYEATSKYSVRPLRGRFKGWPHVPRGLEEYIVSQGLEGEYEDVLVMIRARCAAEPAQTAAPTWQLAKREPLPGAGKIFGAPLTASPLAFGPTNEQGVVFLFGMLAERLGFVLTRIQTEFPDGEALMRLDEDQWQHVRIEFEYESRNFLKHQHKSSDCDVIVCWSHNWPECPLTVVELKGVAKERVGQGDSQRLESRASGE